MKTAPRLFGTDGIRGRALEPPLDEDTVRRLGHCLALRLRGSADPPRLLLAGDTRRSTEVLAAWLGGSFAAAGGRVTWAGVLPTPAVSRLLRTDGFTAGVVISASHNPASDNGIKVISSTGEKIPDGVERELEAAMPAARPRLGPILPRPETAYLERYLDLIVATHGEARPLSGARIVVDAAHGAASGVAETFFERLGARVSSIASAPDGDNINAGCGATAADGLAEAVVATGGEAGVALDGDADRALLADETGRVLDGDDILLAWARDLSRRRRLPGGRVVATVMSNFGLERALHSEGLELHRCGVGDRVVWTAMKELDAALGGEQSGHVICSHLSVTGDGLLTASHVLAIGIIGAHRASELSDLVRMPQVLLNIPVREKIPFEGLPTVSRELADTRRALHGRGRILLRYSGTEALARVMVEGEDATEINGVATQLADAIRVDLR